MSNRPKRAPRWAWLGFLSALGLLVSGVIVAVPASAATPKVTVSPSTNLKNGQVVTVTGTGFTPNWRVYVAQCGPVNSGTSANCKPGAAVAQADAKGKVSLKFKVIIGKVGVFNDIPCDATHKCRVSVSNFGFGKTDAASAFITFAPQAPTKPTGVKVAQAKNRTVTVTWKKSKARGTAVTGYAVQAKPGKKAWTTIGSTSASTAKLAWSKAKAATKYKFRVIAKSKAGNSTSKAVKLTTKK